MSNETNYCKECGGFIEWDKSTQLASAPPKYKGKCKECGEVSYEFCNKVDSEVTDNE